MRTLLIIGSGSFIGGIFRFLLSQFVQAKFLTSFPIGTLVVNILGSFFLGAVFGIFERVDLSQELRLFLITGIIGGFTTFSAFANETVALLQDGEYIYSSSPTQEV